MKDRGAAVPRTARPQDRRRRLSGLAGLGWIAGLALAAAALALLDLGDTVLRLAALGGAVAGALGLAYAVRLHRAGRAAVRAGARMRHAVDALPGGLLLVSPGGAKVYANSVFRSLVQGQGRAPIEALGDLFADDAIGREALEALQACAAAGAVGRNEIAMLSPTGQRAWWEVAVYPVPGLAGFTLWTIDDVSERREAQQVAQEERGKLADFMASAPIGFFSVNEAGDFQFVNDTLARWLQTTPQALTDGSLRLADLVADGLDSDAPAYAPFAERARAGADGYEVGLQGPSGQTFRAHITQSLVRDADGKLHTRSVVRDLSQQLQWEDALRRSEQRFRTYFDQAPVGIVLLGADGSVTQCNAAFLELIAAEEIEAVGQPLVGMIDPRDRDVFERTVAELNVGAQPSAHLEVRLGSQGEHVASLFLGRMDEAGADAPSSLLLHFIDITESKRLEMQVTQSQKMQAVGQLAGGIAHDFNNLLTAMIGFCDLLLLRHRPGEQSFADIMHIKQNANRAANLVRQLLAFSRQQTLQPKVVNVTDVLGELANLLRRLLGEGVELKMVHGRDLGTVRVDEGQLEQVIINLAVNARDAMPEGGTLSIGTAPLVLETPLRHGTEAVPPGEYVQIEVEDTGTGIPEDIIDRIFDPFFSTKEVGSGTGLGLSTVYGIVKQTGGFVFVDSKTGNGTTFRILLPRHHAERDAGTVATEVAPAAELPADLTGVGTVLVVEDEDPVRLFAARALRNKGYRVLEAKSPESALELLEEQGSKIDLMITDVVMPRMDGPSLVARVRERIPSLRVLYISGYAEEAVTERIAVAGDAYFLPKPFSLAQLAARVKEVMLAGAVVERALPRAKKTPRKAARGGNAKAGKPAAIAEPITDEATAEVDADAGAEADAVRAADSA